MTYFLSPIHLKYEHNFYNYLKGKIACLSPKSNLAASGVSPAIFLAINGLSRYLKAMVLKHLSKLCTSVPLN